MGQLAAIRCERLGLEKLRDTFVQPGRAASGRELINKRMSQLMLQHMSQFRCHRCKAANGDAEFSIIDGPGPRGTAGDVIESLLGIEGHQDMVTRWCAKVAD